jgi:hypothetical protein
MRNIECDRCHTTQLISPHCDPGHIPATWGSFDGYHLCPDCDDLFHVFIQGAAVPAIASMQAPNRGYLGPDRRIAPPREVTNDRRRKIA